MWLSNVTVVVIILSYFMEVSGMIHTNTEAHDKIFIRIEND